MGNYMSDEVTGIVPIQGCPKEKVFLYGEASGIISVKCPNCSGFVLIDLSEPHKVHQVDGAKKMNRACTD